MDTSTISTIKVLWPTAKSSLAPILVNILSVIAILALVAGTNDPIWAINVIKATSSVKTPNNYTFTYSPNGYELTGINGSHSEASVQYSYLLNGVEVEKISNVGNYQVVLTLPESQHYNSSSKTIEVILQL